MFLLLSVDQEFQAMLQGLGQTLPEFIQGPRAEKVQTASDRTWNDSQVEVHDLTISRMKN